LNACDTSVSPFLSASVKLGQLLANCYPIVSHADGTMVTGQNPARAGETVTIYATGVGWAVGSLGVPARSGGVPIDPSLVLIGFDFRPDIVGGIHRVPAARPAIGRHPDYAGAVGDLVGIYQISVTLPASLPPETRACRGAADTNVGVNLAVGPSFDGIRLCVVP
jgi:hypothetical protein